MKTTTILAILVGALMLLFIQPVFAQTDNDSPAEIGSGAWGSTDPSDSDVATPPSFNAALPSFDEPYNDGQVLAPAPNQPEEPAPESMFVPQGPVGLIERPGLPPISPSSPELTPPDSFATPAGGFDGRIH
jgi:hypothetical protein